MSQVFKNFFSESVLFNFLDTCCEKSTDKQYENYYEFDPISFKKAKYDAESLKHFYKSIKPYYHKSKNFYIDRERTYKNFVTIIRQICKFLKITYKSKIKYRNSDYSIIYFIDSLKTQDNC
jgi:hypothetical protein